MRDEMKAAIEQWRDAELGARKMRRTAEMVWGAALMRSEAKNAESRKAEADAAAAREGAAADEAEVHAAAAYHWMLWLRGQVEVRP